MTTLFCCHTLTIIHTIVHIAIHIAIHTDIHTIMPPSASPLSCLTSIKSPASITHHHTYPFSSTMLSLQLQYHHAYPRAAVPSCLTHYSGPFPRAGLALNCHSHHCSHLSRPDPPHNPTPDLLSHGGGAEDQHRGNTNHIAAMGQRDHMRASWDARYRKEVWGGITSTCPW